MKHKRNHVSFLINKSLFHCDYSRYSRRSIMSSSKRTPTIDPINIPNEPPPIPTQTPNPPCPQIFPSSPYRPKNLPKSPLPQKPSSPERIYWPVNPSKKYWSHRSSSLVSHVSRPISISFRSLRYEDNDKSLPDEYSSLGSNLMIYLIHSHAHGRICL